MQRKRPNILLITCHDLGRFLGCYGIDTVATPHLDALAADGIRFTQAFCTAPQCSPSRASLFTGRYPHSNGMMGLTNVGCWDMHPQEQHIAQLLGQTGYRTGIAGVYHETIRNPQERFALHDFVECRRGEQVSDTALQLLKRYAAQDAPFYLEVGYFEPHRSPAKEREEAGYLGFIGGYIEADAAGGVTVPPYLRDTEEARKELAELQGAVRYLDLQVGRVLQGLKELGLEENTLVIFTTDHGLALPRAKCSLYDPGLEIALIMRLPSREWAGGIGMSTLVSNVDIVPTLLDVAGIPVSREIQGRSLIPSLDGDVYEERDCIYGEMTYHDYYDPRRCIRSKTFKLIVNFSGAPFFMDPSQSWSRRTDPVVPAQPALAYHPLVELYDLVEDPWEQRNVADLPGLSDIQDELLGRLFHWMQATHDPILEGAVTSPMHRSAVEALEGKRHKNRVRQ